jgi:hypothetical protein
MENKKLLKILLTILTVIVVVALPIWVGPSKIDNRSVPLILEWAIGLVTTVAAALGVTIVGYIGHMIYDFWNGIIN